MVTTTRGRASRIAGYVVIGLGVVLMVLGMFEIGGLFNVGVGLVAVCLGVLLVFVEDDGDRRV